ncbi:MAG: tRNA pseudouridine synthase [Francisellaceae bacterium]|nr:tRNA pseudouridine synthase [Francisellaceae bacterium]
MPKALPKRIINGLILLDKPKGISSNKALQEVKHLLNAKKAGHTGSLDPLATGLLPICLGEATKFSSFLLDSTKHYLVTAELGIKTTTLDLEGEIIQRREVPPISHEYLERVLNSFRGKLQQIPPMFSAIKINGKALYEHARLGETIERQPRDVIIYELNLLKLTPCSLSLEVKCSKGTYIRSLMDDIGEQLGCGATVTELRRLSVAHYTQDLMISLEDLHSIKAEQGLMGLEALLHPLDIILTNYPLLTLESSQIQTLRQGKVINLSCEAVIPGLVRLYDQSHLFLGLGEIDVEGCLVAKRLMAF